MKTILEVQWGKTNRLGNYEVKPNIKNKQNSIVLDY